MYEIFEQLCNKFSVTPYRVCKETGLTTATISNWKAGRYTPKADKLQKIADYFGVTLDYLRTGMGPETKNEYYTNPETAELAQDFLHNEPLRLLFDAAKDAAPEDVMTTYNMLMALKKKERDMNAD